MSALQSTKDVRIFGNVSAECNTTINLLAATLYFQEDLWAPYLQNEENNSNFHVIDQLKDAILSGQADAFKSLLHEHGLSCDQSLPTGFGQSGKRAIFLACETGQPDVVDLLLSLECSLRADESQFSPLMAACASPIDDRQEDLAKCVRLLLNKGKVDPNAFQTQKITPLMLASKHGKDQVGHDAISFLRRNNNDIPIQVVTELLRSSNININAQDSQRWTSLMYAVDAGHGHIARLLLEAGARPDLAGSDGMLPADLAVSKNNATLQDVLNAFSSIKVRW